MEPIVVVSLIAAVASLASAVLVFLSARGRNKVDYKTALDTRIDARVSEQLSTAWTQIDALVKQNGSQADQLARQTRIERVLFRYMSELRRHIHEGAPPPPPTIPLELVEWYELNKDKG